MSIHISYIYIYIYTHTQIYIYTYIRTHTCIYYIELKLQFLAHIYVGKWIYGIKIIMTGVIAHSPEEAVLQVWSPHQQITLNQELVRNASP